MQRLIPLFCVIAATGCAKKELTTESTTSTQRAAEAAGANQVPQAALALQLSNEHLEQAKDLYEDGKEDKAKSMLMRAEADAELATVLAVAADEKASANAAMENVRKVQSQH
jgi:hypothetical protein